jgi:hypothetical protein
MAPFGIDLLNKPWLVTRYQRFAQIPGVSPGDNLYC